MTAPPVDRQLLYRISDALGAIAAREGKVLSDETLETLADQIHDALALAPEDD